MAKSYIISFCFENFDVVVGIDGSVPNTNDVGTSPLGPNVVLHLFIAVLNVV